jgi:Secretion system C-terminal sorting domain
MGTRHRRAPAGESQSIRISDDVINACNYIIQSNPGVNKPICLTSLPTASNDEVISLSEALAIATDTKVYSEFPIIMHWYDSKRLFNYLVNHIAFKNSHATLLNFYNNTLNDAIAQERLADLRLQQLINSITSTNPAYREASFGEAEGANENIIDTELQDANEQAVNDIYIRLLKYGFFSLNEDDKDLITSLANSCPYSNGSAVFKARSLYAMYNPAAMYDDIKFCNAVGVYKEDIQNSNLTGLSSQEMELLALSQIKASPENIKLNEHDLLIFPNPTEGIIHIQYNELIGSEIEIMDATGRIVKKIILPEADKEVEFNLTELASGLYTYIHKVNGKQLNIGKLNKQ